MPLYKVWDVSRKKRKAVVANRYTDFAKKGKKLFNTSI